MVPKWISKLLLLIGVAFAVLGLGVHEYFMITQRLHIEYLMQGGLTWGLSFILLGIIYALTPRTLTRVLMGAFMLLANVGFLCALWILFSARGTSYYAYLYFIEWILLPTWLIINILGAYYLLKVMK
jgi:hypothetical protein